MSHANLKVAFFMLPLMPYKRSKEHKEFDSKELIKFLSYVNNQASDTDLCVT